LKRSVLIRCLTALLVLSLASGSAQAGLLMLTQPYDEHAHSHHHVGDTSAPRSHDHHHGAGDACSCCGGYCCTTATLAAPDIFLRPMKLAVMRSFVEPSRSLSGRELVPDPDPPRPTALI
jgi:hypothetical protein